MKLAASNIAWLPGDAVRVYAMMQEHGLTGLEIAAGLAFPHEADPFQPSDESVRALDAQLSSFGISIVSMQSLLFGAENARLFGTLLELAAFEAAMMRAICLAGRLGIPNLVFGSPTNRAFPETMDPMAARKFARGIFRKLGDRACSAGTVLSIEPNPAVYGTNFLTTVMDAARFVAEVGHPAVMLNFDMGSLSMNGEADLVTDIFEAAGGNVSHVHISEPHLAPAPDDEAFARHTVAAIRRTGYDRWFSIEMRRPERDSLVILESCMVRASRLCADIPNGAEGQALA